VLDGLASGSVDIVVGTHALLTDDVKFRSLGAVIIDEQHRFGVEQRATLREKGRSRSTEEIDPDLLVMTATPIPRTAAMVVFGDLDLSVLDELPGGAKPIETVWARSDAEVATCWQRVRDEVAAGRRAYVICPLIEGSERVEATSAVQERDRLVEHELRGLRVGLLHGQMKGPEKEEVMARFRIGSLDVLVATVVIEVGVDVPEASVIVIEDAWRFGLAQLHQLRGRVGRDRAQSYCFLLGEPPSEDGTRRLEALVSSNDGFVLAEIDLDLRGEGHCWVRASAVAVIFVSRRCATTRICCWTPSGLRAAWSTTTCCKLIRKLSTSCVCLLTTQKRTTCSSPEYPKA